MDQVNLKDRGFTLLSSLNWFGTEGDVRAVLSPWLPGSREGASDTDDLSRSVGGLRDSFFARELKKFDGLGLEGATRCCEPPWLTEEWLIGSWCLPVGFPLVWPWKVCRPGIFLPKFPFCELGAVVEFVRSNAELIGRDLGFIIGSMVRLWSLVLEDLPEVETGDRIPGSP